jgi:hypothetical protein
MRVVVPMAVCLLACVEPDAAPRAEAHTDTDVPEDGFSVVGQVVDLERNPVVDLFVTVSTEFCIPDRTDGEGGFEVGSVTDGPKRLITYGETASNGLFASVVFDFDAAGEVRLADPVVVPALVERYPVDPDSLEEQSIESEDGLELKMAPGALELAPFAPDEVQIARVPIEDAPPFVPDGVTLADLFVLHPIRSTLDPPASVVFPEVSGASPGAAVVFFALDYETGQLRAVATGSVNDQNRPATHEGEGIPELTWIGIALEES